MEILELPSLNTEHKLDNLARLPYFDGLFGNINGLSSVKPSDKTLTAPYPKPLGKKTTERKMLYRHLKLKGLPDQELLKEAVNIFPLVEVLLGAMINAIIESEEGPMSLIPTVVDTWILGFCVQNGELRLLHCVRDLDGWNFDSTPVLLNIKWHAKGLLLLATDSSKL